MAIENRNLAGGTRLVARFKKQEYACTVKLVVEGQDPLKKVYVLEHDGSEHKSPSAAGSAVMGGVACNGWRFWSVAGQQSTSVERPAKTAAKGSKRKAKPGNGGQLIKPLDDQADVPEGSVRYFCSGCMAGFNVDDGTEPVTCPEGHSAELTDL